MLTNNEFEKIIHFPKQFLESSEIILPFNERYPGKNIRSLNGDDLFILNITRGNKELDKISYQIRQNSNNNILLRIETKGPRHRNPNGDYISGPHIHIYIENFEDDWAIPLDNTNFLEYIEKIISFTENTSLNYLKKDYHLNFLSSFISLIEYEKISKLPILLKYFLNYFRIINIPNIIENPKVASSL